jgi:hypothetical protein
MKDVININRLDGVMEFKRLQLTVAEMPGASSIEWLSANDALTELVLTDNNI